MSTLTIYAPAGVLPDAAALRRAQRRLRALGFDAVLDDSVLARHQRFAGNDDARLAAVHRVALAAPSVALAARGGYGCTRLLDRIDWRLLAASVEQGTRWVGFSDITALQLGLLAHAGQESWAGPTALETFGRSRCRWRRRRGHARLLRRSHGRRAGSRGLSHRVRLRRPVRARNALGRQPGHGVFTAGHPALAAGQGRHPVPRRRGRTPLPRRALPAAVAPGRRAGAPRRRWCWADSPTGSPRRWTRGYTLKTVVALLRATTPTPVLTGLPFGHGHPRVCLPVGRRVQLVVQGRDAFIGW